MLSGEAAGGTLGKEFLKARPPRRKKNDSDPPHTRRTLQQVQAVPPLGERQQDVATKQHDESPSDLQQRMSVEHFNISRQQLNVFSNDMHDWAAHQPSEVVEPVMQYVSTLFAQFKPSLERCTQRLYGAQHVGSRCAVYRKGDKTSYPGQLVDYNPLSGHHKIRHDDGSMFWELLGSSDVVSTIECCTSNDRQEAIARDNPPAMVVCAGDGLCSASPEPESGRKSGPDADQHGQAEEAPMQEIGLNKSPSLPRKDRSLPVGASGVVPSFSLQSWLRSYQHRATAGA